MLVLRRKKGERVRIGKDVVVIVNWASGNIVSLGFEAPPEVKILRDELLPDEEKGKEAA